ncbi:hypothetical protein SAMN04490247_0705 [Salimicrobium halophilum]|uniref:Uncharacterized protein n=1 Tax=Salimicrobium halophilum TaxID=86666 RepID=A0A1G8QYC6_9BACI|nr:hypothetical protein SAMN04490247_0705 [Salimicrobium halophilum]
MKDFRSGEVISNGEERRYSFIDKEVRGRSQK